MKPSDMNTIKPESPTPSSSARSDWKAQSEARIAQGLKGAQFETVQDKNPPLSMRDPKTLTPDQKAALDHANNDPEVQKAA